MAASLSAAVDQEAVKLSNLHALPQLHLSSYRPETFVYNACDTGYGKSIQYLDPFIAVLLTCEPDLTILNVQCRDGHEGPNLADWIEVFRASIPSFQQRAEQDPAFDSSTAKVHPCQQSRWSCH